MPSKALFFFPDEEVTGIASTWLIEGATELREGQSVTVNWQGEKVQASILALSGTYLAFPVMCVRFQDVSLTLILDVFLADSSTVLHTRHLEWGADLDKENAPPPPKMPRISSRRIRGRRWDTLLMPYFISLIRISIDEFVFSTCNSL